jgi:hypothetical protein
MGMRQVAARAARAATWSLSRRRVSERASAAHEDQDVKASEGGADGVDEVFAAVADDGLEGHGDADLVELFGEIEGVGVLAVRGEHLGADGDDFGFHECSSQPSAISVQSSTLS